MDEHTRKAVTLYDQAREKLAREATQARELAAWETELARANYYDWFLERVLQDIDKEDAS